LLPVADEIFDGLGERHDVKKEVEKRILKEISGNGDEKRGMRGVKRT
jgi:hypothetical protein